MIGASLLNRESVINKSKKVLWDEICRLYTDERLAVRQIFDELHTNQYFDPQIIPSPQVIYDYLHRIGISQKRTAEKALEKSRKKELDDLKARLKKQKFDQAKQLILDGLNSGDLNIDDLTRENVGRLQALIKDLTDTIGNSKNNKNKLEAVKILDKVIQTLLKARILEGKDTSKEGGKIEVELPAAQQLLEFFAVKKEEDKDNG